MRNPPTQATRYFTLHLSMLVGETKNKFTVVSILNYNGGIILKALISTVFFGTLIFGCKKRDFSAANNSSLFGRNFSSEVTGKRVCATPVTFANVSLITAQKPTKVYHWTDSATALSNPHEYLSGLAVAGNKENDRGNFVGEAGFGLSVALDPFQSYDYGKTLIEMEITAGTSFYWIDGTRTGSQTASKEIYKQRCPGAIFHWSNSLRDPSEGRNKRAMTLWDLGAINPSTVKIYTKLADIPSSAVGLDTLFKRDSAEFLNLPLTMNNYLADVFNGNTQVEPSMAMQVNAKILIDQITQCNTTMPAHDQLDSKGMSYLKAHVLVTLNPNMVLPFGCDMTPFTPEMLLGVSRLWKVCSLKLALEEGTNKTCDEIVPALASWKASTSEISRGVGFYQEQRNKLRAYWSQQYSLADW